MTVSPEAIARLEARLTSQHSAMLDDLAELVGCESPTDDVARCRATAALVADQARRMEIPARVVESGGRPHVLLGALGLADAWGTGPAPGQVLLLGHLDTVWPAGTGSDWPFVVSGGVASGPGAYDMKAGIVQGLHALGSLAAGGTSARASMLVTSDEEVGSPTSSALIESLARSADAVLVLEPGPVGGVKIARKGWMVWRVRVHGRAAHAGLEPERGVNAGVELARLALALDAMHDPERGLTVVPTLLSAGSAPNVVPEHAEMTVDVRSFDPAALVAFEHAIREIASSDTGTGARVSLERVTSRPPLPESSGVPLLARAQEIAARLGLGALVPARVGGVSDGNLAAAAGAPTLDGLGAVGGGAHARDEHVLVDETWRRSALVAALVESLAESPARAVAAG
ncbi:MAG TPA: M20/M25/M40 family metallo-hydrolase [Acidimicrobiales bacterium]|nr:M20/M25/M40 family metallo-hydrolase [Acidimicrobiales bacterium]